MRHAVQDLEDGRQAVTNAKDRDEMMVCSPAMRDVPRAACVVMLCAASALWAAWLTSGIILGVTVLLGWVLIGLSVIDLRTLRLPDEGTLGLIIAGLVLSAAGVANPMLDAATGAAAGFATFAAIGWIWYRWRGTEALGLGDAKLFSAAGAWVGATALPSVLLIACAAGLMFAMLHGRAGTRLNGRRAIPFGPALGVGFWVTWLYGPISI